MLEMIWTAMKWMVAVLIAWGILGLLVFLAKLLFAMADRTPESELERVARKLGIPAEVLSKDSEGGWWIDRQQLAAYWGVDADRLRWDGRRVHLG